MNKISPSQRHKMIKIILTGFVVIAITTVCFILPIRPTRSESEKRSLAKFPSFSFSALADGSYFSDISLWFSDTVPFRDNLLEINAKLQNFLGTSGVLKGFNEGAVGDEIPDPVTPVTPVTPNPDDEQTTIPEDTTFPDDDKEAQNVEHLSNILVCDNAAFEYYNFVKSTADSYAAAINRASQLFSSSANVFVSVVPTSTDITLNTKVRQKLSVSDQKEATNYILGSIVDNVNKVDSFDNIKMHRDEYVYFRTDHHWTALGAYYTYEKFCEAKGITPLAITDFEVWSFDNFLGSFYNDSGSDPALGATPDRVDAYIPPCEYSMTITDSSGQTYASPLLYDETNAPASYKYGTFICGDNPLSVIENLDKQDGESCLVVKESFGNAFVPFLVYHYKYVYVVDYRYYNGTVSSLVSNKGIDDVLFLNNISMTRSSSLVRQLTNCIG